MPSKHIRSGFSVNMIFDPRIPYCGGRASRRLSFLLALRRRWKMQKK
jgi:hypothetical protein